MLRDGLDANPHVPRGRMTASTRAINLKDKRLHFLLIPSSTRYFGISFLIVALTRPWNYLFETEGGQSCAGINCENCHSFMTVALSVPSKRARFPVEGLCPGSCSDTCKTSPRKSLWGMKVWIIHSMLWRAFLCTSRSQPRRDGPCLCTLSLSWGKPRSRAALPSVVQRYQLPSKFCTDIPAAGGHCRKRAKA